MYCNVHINKFDIFCRLLQNRRSKRPKVVIPPLCHKREAHILSVAFIYKDLIFLRGQVKGQGKKPRSQTQTIKGTVILYVHLK